MSDHDLAVGYHILDWSEDDTFRGDCPHCSTSAVEFKYLWSSVDSEYYRNFGDNLEYPVFISVYCARCRKPSIFRVKFDNMYEQRFSFYVETCHPPIRQGWKGSLEFVPESIAAGLDEAVVSHSVGAQVGATLVMRRVIQLITRDQGASGSNLADEINSLDIPQELKDIAHSSRLIGNEAAHPNPSDWERVEATDVALLIDLTTQMIQQLYVIPGQAKRLLERASEVAGQGKLSD